MTHRDLDVYKQSIEFVVEIYKLTNSFPTQERYGLSSQMQRAAVSIPSNIAEGATRNGTKEYIHFLYISAGSASELETQLNVASLLGYISKPERYESLNVSLNSIRMKILQLIKNLETKYLLNK